MREHSQPRYDGRQPEEDPQMSGFKKSPLELRAVVTKIPDRKTAPPVEYL
jgi:hypothetical protein